MVSIPLSAFHGITVSGLTASPLSGFTSATTFSCNLSTQAGITQAAITSNYNLIWWFGDGTYSTDYSPSHVYSWPGIYEVKLGIFNNNTGITPLTFSQTVTASNFLVDNLSWDYSQWNNIMVGNPLSGACFFGYQSCKSGVVSSGPVPLTFNYQTSITDNSTLNFSLYSDNSLSQPYSEIPVSQISNLRPRWRFTTVSASPLDDGLVITNFKPISSTEIRIDSNGNLSPTGTLVGLSGSGSFYYIDDIPSMVVHNYTGTLLVSAHPTTIWVTLDTINIPNTPSYDYVNVPSYSNSLVSLSSYYYVQSLQPDNIGVTINGSVPFNSVYWPGVESRFVTTVNSSHLTNSTATFLSDVPLLNYPLNTSNTNDAINNTFQLYIQSTSAYAMSADYNLSTTPTHGNLLKYTLQRYDSLGRDIGGYYLGTFTPETTGAATIVTRSTLSNGASGFAYVNDLLPNTVTGYNPYYISIPPTPVVNYINNSYTNSYGKQGFTGQSRVFNIVDFNSTYFTRKFNGSFDYGAQLKSYALQPTINQNSVFFDSYLSSIAGTSATNDDTYGGVVYEKIANFVQNNADPSCTNVNAFYSLAESLGLTLDNYNYDVPPTLGRIFDLYSVQQSVVWGARSQYARNFALSAGHVNLNTSLREYNIYTTMVSAGQKIVVNDLFNSDYYELIEVSNITSYSSVTARGLNALLPVNAYPVSAYPLSAYPLSAFLGWGLKTPVAQNYRFFVYNDVVDGQQVEGLVNWDDSMTTLPELSGTSHLEWVKDEGILETIYNYYIHKGLGLIK